MKSKIYLIRCVKDWIVLEKVLTYKDSPEKIKFRNKSYIIDTSKPAFVTKTHYCYFVNIDKSNIQYIFENRINNGKEEGKLIPIGLDTDFVDDFLDKKVVGQLAKVLSGKTTINSIMSIILGVFIGVMIGVIICMIIYNQKIEDLHKEYQNSIVIIQSIKSIW